MEFRAPIEASQQNAKAMEYLTKDLSDPTAGRKAVEDLIQELGNAVYSFPDWHPILTIPPANTSYQVTSISEVDAYKLADHTVKFVRGFVTCPYSDKDADKLVETVIAMPGLHAYRLSVPLYADGAYPVVVQAYEVELEADGTIRSRDALAWFAQQAVKYARSAEVAETWWNMRDYILGRPHGQRSSLFVNQHTGVHMRKILETLNNSGMFGPVKEESLDMLSQKKRDAINETLIRTAVSRWDKASDKFTFELRGETCKAAIRDTWDDGMELSIRVEVGDGDVSVSGFYYAEGNKITFLEPRGKRAVAEKFV